MIVSVTGHRPKDLGGYHIQPKVNAFAKHIFRISTTPEYVITGMALGWDQAVAEACVSLSIPFKAYVPSPGQESRWPMSSQKRYQELLSLSTEVYYIDDMYGPSVMQMRNQAMVDASELVVALHNPTKTYGGTWNCIQYAKEQNHRTVNLWSRWIKFQKETT